MNTSGAAQPHEATVVLRKCLSRYSRTTKRIEGASVATSQTISPSTAASDSEASAHRVGRAPRHRAPFTAFGHSVGCRSRHGHAASKAAAAASTVRSAWRRPDDLQADRQSILGEAGRDRDRRLSGEIERVRERHPAQHRHGLPGDVARHAGPEREGGHRGRRRQQQVEALEEQVHLAPVRVHPVHGREVLARGHRAAAADEADAAWDRGRPRARGARRSTPRRTGRRRSWTKASSGFSQPGLTTSTWQPSSSSNAAAALPHTSSTRSSTAA